MKSGKRAAQTATSFEATLASVCTSLPRTAQLAYGECHAPGGKRCALCFGSTLGYSAELRAKTEALHAFWKEHRLPGSLSPVTASPKGRKYRTTSKRKVIHSRRGPLLVLLSPDEQGSVTPLPVAACAIEPAEHTQIFSHVATDIQRHAGSPLAAALQYVIIKGNYAEFSVIFNVETIDGPLVKAANALSKGLTKAIPQVKGVFLYEDEAEGGYYMGARNRGKRPALKKLFGKDFIQQRVLDREFRFSPASFSQINLSAVDAFVSTTASLLGPMEAATLFDLYCGYGLFGVALAHKARQVIGTEIDHVAVDAAKENARRNNLTNVRFFQSDISLEGLARVLRGAAPHDVAILDPPRGGTAEGVIEAVARHGLRRVVHIFCNIDIVARELKRWEAAGYCADKIIPVDMFPGTASMEILVELSRRPG